MICLILALPAIQLQAIKTLLDQAIDLSLSRIDLKARIQELDLPETVAEFNTTIRTINPVSISQVTEAP
jgi:hypothetical protein